MPVARIEIPTGLSKDTKTQLMKEVSKLVHEAWPIPDTRVYLTEFSPENTAFDGVQGAPFRTTVDYIAPPGLSDAGKRRLVAEVGKAVARACDSPTDTVALPSGKRVTTQWVLQWIREVPLENAAFDALMAYENPMVLEFVPQH